MEFLLTAIVFVLIFSVLVMIHEWGHFAAARRAGIKVEEFGFGLPPRIWGIKKGETLYSLNAIPFGGFVKLLGEDSRDAKMVKNPRSFIAQRPRTRLFVLTAGVLMNYLLAVFLLTIGFTVGMEPLIINGDDLFARLEDGTIELASGVRVKTVEEGSVAERAGLKALDQIMLVNDREIVDDKKFLEQIVKPGTDNVYMDIVREGESQTLQLAPMEGEALGFELYPLFYLPRVVMNGVEAGSVSERAGLRQGDVVLNVNGTPVYDMEGLDAILREGHEFSYKVLRAGAVEETVNVVFDGQASVVVSSVVAGTPAHEADLRSGDVILSVNDVTVTTPEQVTQNTRPRKEGPSVYALRRGDQTLTQSILPQENGLIGIGISYLNVSQTKDLTLYTTRIPSSVLNIKDVQYPVWIAPIKAVEESVRLSVFTVGTFGQVIKSIATEFTVPEGVAGPVGIYQMTGQFVQEGLLSVLRFMALLSLSLAILNIFPFPALDGGRVFFVLAELVIGRRVGQKVEMYIHAIGFMLLMGMILFITYSDILRFF